MKNRQFLTNQADILSILPIHQLVILTKFGNDCIKIGDFSLMTKFLASSIFFSSVFMFWHRVNRSTTTFTYLMLAIIFPMHVLINRELPNVETFTYLESTYDVHYNNILIVCLPKTIKRKLFFIN